jgi:hypothetical protein
VPRRETYGDLDVPESLLLEEEFELERRLAEREAGTRQRRTSVGLLDDEEDDLDFEDDEEDDDDLIIGGDRDDDV